VEADIEFRPSHGDLVLPTEKTLLLLDEDPTLCRRLHRVFDGLGFSITIVGSVVQAVAFARSSPPAFALLALRLRDGCGLTVLKALREGRPEARVVMLTAYGDIPSAVAAIRGGAVDYLIKPADDQSVVQAVMGGQPGETRPPLHNQKSANQVRWDHIQHVYELCGRNISQTARSLDMHRRTLQRTFAKGAPPQSQAPPDLA
jgi:two-component system response regulator RegA